MDSSETSLEIIESQKSTDGQNGGESNMYGLELLANIRFSDFLAFPGVYVPMNPEIYGAVCAGKQTSLEIIRSYGNPMACLKSDQGDSVLHLAAAWGNVELVKSIVSECPCLLMELDSRDQLPLHVAAHAGHVDVVKALVEIITFVSATLSAEEKERLNLYVWKDINGDTPLHLAMRVIDIKAAPCLVEAHQLASFLPNKDGITPLYMAVEKGIVLVKEMLKPANNGGPDLQLEGKKSLVHAALKSRSTAILDIILKKYPSLEDERDEEGNTCLSFGASIRFLPGVQRLLHRSKKSAFVPNDDGSFPIHIAGEKGHTYGVMLILELCPETLYLLNKQAQNILHILSKSGKVSELLFIYLRVFGFMNKLMEKQDVDGNTPLHLATINWHPRMLFLLLTNYNGNCMYIRNNKGQTPLDIAELNMQPGYIYKERLTFLLLNINTTSKRDNPKMLSKKKVTRLSNALGGENKEQYINTLLVVAALVATVTFAAAFTIPGGFNSSGPKLGSAVLANDVKLICFMVFDILAMLLSILTIETLICGQLGDPALVQKSLDAALPYLFSALICMPVAFYCGVYILFAHVMGVLIFLNLTCLIFVYLILIFLGPHVILHVPYIAHLLGAYFQVIYVIVGYMYIRFLKFLMDHKTLLMIWLWLPHYPAILTAIGFIEDY